MPTVNDKFLREELQAAKDQIEALRQSGKVSPEADAVFRVLMPLLTLLLAVLLEKTADSGECEHLIRRIVNTCSGLL